MARRAASVITVTALLLTAACGTTPQPSTGTTGAGTGTTIAQQLAALRSFQPVAQTTTHLADLRTKLDATKGKLQADIDSFNSTYEKCSQELGPSTWLKEASAITDERQTSGKPPATLAAMFATLHTQLHEKQDLDRWASDPLVLQALLANIVARGLSQPKLEDKAVSRVSNVLASIKLDPTVIQGFVLDLNSALKQATATPLAQALDDVIQGRDSTTVLFSTVLIAYMREYFDGRFVTHFGMKIDKPQISTQGIPDAAIAGATTVFFEALFDYLDPTPIAADASWDSAMSVDDQPKAFWGATAKGQAVPTALTVLKTAADGHTNVFGKIPAQKVLDAPKGDACGVTDREARAISTLASWFGNQLVVWNGAALEALSSINVDFVIGGSFAIGDNKTLVTVAKAALEVIGRRAAEHVLYHFFYAAPDTNLMHLLQFFPAQTTASGPAAAASPPAGGDNDGKGGAKTGKSG